jgi:hypothetical protein
LNRKQNEKWALEKAIEIARLSPCAKSKRGVIAWHPLFGNWVKAFNSPPEMFPCSGSQLCKSMCSDIAIHAEERAMFRFISMYPSFNRDEVELLHIKVIGGEPVASKEPSCLRCSTRLLDFEFKGIWLLEDSGLKFYEADEFHRATISNLGIDELLY